MCHFLECWLAFKFIVTEMPFLLFYVMCVYETLSPLASILLPIPRSRSGSSGLLRLWSWNRFFNNTYTTILRLLALDEFQFLFLFYVCVRMQ